MTQQSPSKHAEQFIAVGRRYFEWFNLELLNGKFVEMVAEDQDGDIERAVDSVMEYQRNKNDLRNELKPLGMALAEVMEGAGEDSSGVLEFLYAIDGGGGARVAGTLWPGLQVQLQRWIIRSSFEHESPGQVQQTVALDDPIANHKLADLVNLGQEFLSAQIRIALSNAGVAYKKCEDGQIRWWTHHELVSAYPQLPNGKLKKWLIHLGLVTLIEPRSNPDNPKSEK